MLSREQLEEYDVQERRFINEAGVPTLRLRVTHVRSGDFVAESSWAIADDGPEMRNNAFNNFADDMERDYARRKG